MVSGQSALAAPDARARTEAAGFAALSARRLLVIGGIALIVMGMLFGDIFAVFVLHPNAGRIGQALLASCQEIGRAHV